MDDERTKLVVAVDAQETMNRVTKFAARAKDIMRDTDRLWIIALGSEGAYSWDGFKVCLRRIDGIAEELGPAFIGTAARRQARKHASTLDDFGLLKELPFEVDHDALPLLWCLIYRWDGGEHRVVGVGRSKGDAARMAQEVGVVRNEAALAYLEKAGSIPTNLGPSYSPYILSYKRIARPAAQAAYDYLTQEQRSTGWIDYGLDDAGVVVLREGETTDG